MRILVVHGRYRSSAPSGENIVADQERSALRAAGHWVGTFERDSDEIAGWSLARKASLPARVVWNGAVKRDLARSIAATRPDVVHIHNTFPLVEPVGPARLSRGRCSGRGHVPQLPAALRDR
ncbi:hypothetical protein [Nostocoides sp. HKS02]|uniref:hypothetical protein n=1 Tax=Nostocoides sp. HKS02 TaxID=1813880 RepID=UPI0012B4F92B|nr:hypothetical protein [Tetrasphaera sp. HKS02]QGN59151.1 hypothetical protein GKE56_16055 [Tetrasphaera sp. HKS02]